METTKKFDNLTWADLTIIDDELKAVQEFNVKSLKYRDLWIVHRYFGMHSRKGRNVYEVPRSR